MKPYNGNNLALNLEKQGDVEWTWSREKLKTYIKSCIHCEMRSIIV